MAPGLTEIILILIVVFVLFGAGRVPGIMENMAKGVKAFKKGLRDDENQPAKPLPRKDDTQPNG